MVKSVGLTGQMSMTPMSPALRSKEENGWRHFEFAANFSVVKSKQSCKEQVGAR